MKPGKCKGCGLEGAPGPVWGSGEGKMMLVGEWPRDEGEVIGGVALGGAAGRVLRVACHAAGVDREECYATYAVKCLPGKKGPGKGVVEWCAKAWLKEEMEGRRVVVVLGEGALEAVTGEKRGIGEWRGAVWVQGEE